MGGRCLIIMWNQDIYIVAAERRIIHKGFYPKKNTGKVCIVVKWLKASVSVLESFYAVVVGSSPAAVRP